MTTFISLGPTCLGAEILKKGHLRNCTYGFDWVRSGGYFILRFLEIEHQLFIDKYVVNPCIPLLQNEDPSMRTDSTVNPEPIDPIYGYPYLYTPHRDYNKVETREYLNRSFSRLAKQLKRNVKTVFLICDYVNKQGCVYLNNWEKIAEKLEYAFKNSNHYQLDNFEIVFLRIKLSEHRVGFCSVKVKRITNLSTLLVVEAPLVLDEESTRRYLYNIIAKTLTHRFQ